VGTHYKGTNEEITALNTYIKLVRAVNSLNSRLNENLQKLKLTESQFGVLEALYHIGPLNQRELGNKLLKTGGNITMVVDNLEKRGLVKRERGEKDRRFFTVNLTNQGRELIEKIFPLHLEAILNEMKKLQPQEQIQLQKYCKIIGLNINEED